MKRRAFHLTALAGLGLIALPASAKDSKSAATGLAFASPEEAVEHIAASLRDADLGAAVLAFDIERRATNYSFVKMAERLQSISLYNTAPPVKFDFYRDAAKIQFTGEAAAQLRNLAFSLLAPTGTPLDSVISFSDGQDIGQYAGNLEAALDPGRLTNLKVLKTRVPSPQMANSEVNRRNIMSQLGVTGGDDIQERIVLYELDGRTYGGGFNAVRYGDVWQARALVSYLAGTTSFAHAGPMSVEEFDAWVR
ncbi:hypothetical protein [Devosia sp. SL43]|uniref:hypothetical protein n=1 Tax=Devosia sp. SL43 TaxID=2806348 RepID=UPI001F347CD2|nr:hypothetical protein [Devosia sp. SL43]UJW83951.1 hypothetical protein IM737_10785 [Devosia sp. SL43]